MLNDRGNDEASLRRVYLTRVAVRLCKILCINGKKLLSGPFDIARVGAIL